MTLNSLFRSRYRNYLFLVPLALIAPRVPDTYTVVSIQSALNGSGWPPFRSP